MGRALMLLVLIGSAGLAAPSVAESPKALTNNDVVQMVQAGLPESTILLSVENAPAAYSTDPADLIALKTAGVTPSVLDAMLKKARESAPPPAVTTADKSSTAESVGIALPLDLGSAEKAKYQACADEINARRRADGIPEIRLIDGEEAVAARESKAKRKLGLGLLKAVGSTVGMVAPIPGMGAIGAAGSAASLGATAVDASDTVREAGGLGGKNYERLAMAQQELMLCISEQNAEKMRAQAMENTAKMMEQAQSQQPNGQ